MAFDPVATAVQAAQDFGVDPQLAVNVMYQESSGRHFNDDGSVITSPAGAMGYMGLEPATAASLGVDPSDPVGNIRGGVKYLGQMISRFGSPILGAAAYNAGPGTVERFGGVPPYKETQNYVASVLPGSDAASASASAPAAAAQPDPNDPANWGANDAPAAPAQGSAPGQAAAPSQSDPNDPANWADPTAAPAGAGAVATPAPKVGDTSGMTAFGSNGDMIDPRTGKPFSDDVQATFRTLRPIIDQKAGAGSANNPYATATAADIDAVPVGGFYVDGTQKGAPILKKGDPAGLNQARDQELRTAAASRGDGITGLGDLASGATAPFNALLAGGIGGAEQGLYNLGASAFGAPINVSAGQRGEAAYEASRAGQRAADDSDPILSGLGRVAGGFAYGAPEIGSVAPVAGGALRAGAQIAGIGAVNGAAETDGGLGQRAMGAAGGAAGALATAGALGVAGSAAARLGGRFLATQAAQAMSDTTGGAFFGGLQPGEVTPAASWAARNYVTRAMAAEGVAPADLTANGQPGLTAAESIGPNAITGAANLARRPGLTGKAANALLIPRAAARADRLMDTIGQVAGVHPAAARGDIEGMVAARQADVGPKYAELRADDTPIWSAVLQQVMDTPVGRQAARDAYGNLANVPGGPSPESAGLVLDHAGNPGIVDPVAAAASRAPADPMDLALNAIRSGRNVRPNGGPSLLQFIGAQGGLNDVGGDVAGLGGDRWHLDLPFRRKIINPQGVGLDEMAERADAAGYFPDAQRPNWAGSDNTHAVGPADLLDAMGRELAGSPRYAEFDPDAADLRNRMDDAQQMMDHLGLDPQKLGNSDIKSAFNALYSNKPAPNLSNAPPPAAEPAGPPGLVPGTAPTFKTWEVIKRTLDASVARDPFGRVVPDSQNLGNANINTASRVLRNELVNIQPAYGEALDAAGDYMGARSKFAALKGKLFNGGFSAADLDGALKVQTPDGVKPVSDSEMQAARGAALGDIYNKAQANLLTPKMLELPHVQNKLGLLFGQDKASAISAAANREADMIDAERRIPPAYGSQSAPLLEADADQHQSLEGAKVMGVDALTSAFAGNPHGAATQLLGAALTHTVKPGLNVQARNLAGRLLLGSPGDLATWLAAARRPARAFGLFGSGLNAFQSQAGFNQPVAPGAVGLPAAVR